MKNHRKRLVAVLLFLAAACLSVFAQAPLTDNMPAGGVLGQADFVTRTTGKTSSTMNNAFGVAIDPTTGKLFVADRNNNRVLRFSSTAKLTTGGAAEAVLGQPNLDTNTANTGGISAATMNTPVRLYVDAAGRLWVSDYGNRRVLRFDNASAKATGAAADGVLGQPDFVTNTAGTTAGKMNRTTGVFVDGGGRLWVAERDNNRVLRFDNAAAKANGANADGVLGQPDFVTGTTGLSATKMNEPFGVFVDAGGRLWVADDVNNRVLRFDNAAAKANGAAADGVLGQTGFTTNNAPNPTQSGMSNVRGVFGDAQGRIYAVEEFNNNRILIFNNAAAKANGANADNVLGQANFVTSAAAVPPTASSLASPNSMFIDNAANQIWVADAGNNRVVRFDVSDVTFKAGLPAGGVLGQADFVTRTTGKTSSTMNNAFGVAIDPTTGKLFVADRNNNRVLRFSSTAKLTTGGAAEAVLGQPNLDTNTANTGGISAATMNTPVRLYVDAAGRLWVSDYGNRRVLRFDNASAKATGAAADGVLGQPDFVTNTAGTTAGKMNRTTGVFVDGGGRLWVAERDNNRVLRFDNAAAKANGANADGVLGQPDFVTGTTGLSATKMNEPFGVFVDAGGRLWVADDVNNRVLRFDNAAAKANGAAADGVLGQTGFTTNNAPNPTQSGMSNVRGVFGDAQGRIYAVEEFNNNRILIFNNAAAKANGANADNVLGQANFVTSAAAVPPTASSLASPNSMFIDNAANQIWVADAGNNRVVRYDVGLGGPTTSVREVSGQRPTAYALLQNFPNPFNPSTSIRFSLPHAGNVSLEVYNVLGERVAVLLDQSMPAGSFDVQFHAAGLPSGMYLYRLQANGYSSVNKMMLLK
jgi:DNA-binding beta-propeller fold protein YncE